jgi:hypothetical protein
MLFNPAPLDIARQVLVFVHIPKTAGSALTEALVGHFGKEAYIPMLQEKIGKIHANRLRKTIWTARKAARNSILRLRGIHPLMSIEHRNINPDQLRVLHGHVSLGKEPDLGRDPLYITLVRDPVDRFISDYYFRFDIRASWPEGKRERHGFWLYDIDRFADYVYARKDLSELNLQCRYIGGEDNFAAAKRAVDDRVFLAAPMQRVNEFLELLTPVLGLSSSVMPRSNIGRARQKKAPPSEETKAKIREMVSQDQQLFDYISRTFDDLYAIQSAGLPRKISMPFSAVTISSTAFSGGTFPQARCISGLSGTS